MFGSTALSSVLDWLAALAANPYFWGGLAVLVGIGSGIFYVVDSTIMPSYTRHDVSVRVPDVEDRPFEQAKTLMRKKDLDVRRQAGQYNPNVPRGVVVDQTPPARSAVKPDRRVYLTVNAGEVPMVKTPDLSGTSVREAKNRISSAGLEVGTVQPDSIPSPYANTITKQSPAPGDSLRRGRKVDLWYSTGLGETTVVVPNVVGRTLTNARQVLLKNKLRFTVVDTSRGDVRTQRTSSRSEAPVDTTRQNTYYVRRQDRSPGTTVRTGTQIRLFATTDPAAVSSPPDTTSDAVLADTADADALPN